jgi:CubicO group peptidase (beta-lactamase class C family)
VVLEVGFLQPGHRTVGRAARKRELLYCPIMQCAWLLLTLFSLALAPVLGQSADVSALAGERNLEQRIKAEVRRFATETGVPGIAFGVISEGNVVVKEAVGLTGPPDAGSQATEPGTIFHLASLSKPFVATAIMVLTEQRRLALDDRVIKHLPYFRLADDRFPVITIRHLLTHVSGLPDVRDYGWANPEYDRGALERYVRSLASVKLKSAPGEKHSYSNIGYEILGDVIAKASRRTFEEFVMSTIFRPLRMTSSTFLLTAVPRERLALPCVRSEGGLYRLARHFPYNNGVSGNLGTSPITARMLPARRCTATLVTCFVGCAPVSMRENLTAGGFWVPKHFVRCFRRVWNVRCRPAHQFALSSTVAGQR